MEKTNGENVSSATEKKENRVPYSVETPYGFHLDLDFLKYVHDIEKGNTIKRIHIHRRAKQSKFSTLPRNFSVPDNGSHSCSAGSSRTWSAGSYRADAKDSRVFSGNESALRLRYVHELNYRRKDNIHDSNQRMDELAPEDFSSYRDRPQIARASSLPASLPQSTTSTDQHRYLKTPQSINNFGENRFEFLEGPAESKHSVDQIVAAFKRIKELEEQLKTIPELKQTISMLEGENNELNTQLQSLSQLLSNKTEQNSAVANTTDQEKKDEDVADRNGDVGHLSFVAVNNLQFSTIKQQVIDMTKQLDDHSTEVQNLRILVEKQNDELKAKDVYIGDLTRVMEHSEEARRQLGERHYKEMAVNTNQIEDKIESCDKNTYANISVETRSIGCCVLPADLNCSPDDSCDGELASAHAGGTSSLLEHCIAKTGLGGNGETEIVKVIQMDVKEGSIVMETTNVQSHQLMMIDEEEKQHCSAIEQQSSDAPVGQYVKRIQDLLQEQWTYLEHGYPDLASAIKQPASKLSSIQNQLVNSLNLLSSAYSTQTSSSRETAKTEIQQAEASPTSSLKSIMKKKNNSCRSGPISEARAKKNLQFVGVNGGYETTSSEDTSSSEELEDLTLENTEVVEHVYDDPNDVMEDSVVSETGNTEEELQETPSPTEPEAQPNLQRCTVGQAFLSECQILSSHLAELRTTTDNSLRQTLYTVCQEWFRVSSQKSSSPDLVSVYLEEFRSINPQLLQMVVNIADENGNTALHYSVSHSNFRIVKLLLDTGVCDVDHQNKAGYTPVMLTPLASADTEADMEVVKALFSLGNVNLSATQGGQTALMLGVSHGRSDMVKVLLDCGADVNLTDQDGESALMMACQLGNVEIVQLLLSQPDCDVELTDKAGNSALSIVTDSAHSEISDLLQAHTDQRHSCPTSDMEKEPSL